MPPVRQSPVLWRAGGGSNSATGGPPPTTPQGVTNFLLSGQPFDTLSNQIPGGPPSSDPDPDTCTLPTLPTNPNILVIIVDQLRYFPFPYTQGPPSWLPPGFNGSEIIPNITSLASSSCIFNNYCAAAVACTPGRSAMVTGLYTPQTGQFVTESGGPTATPPLQTGFPTWATILQDPALGLPYSQSGNSAYQNVWYFGKWHLSDFLPNGGNSCGLNLYGFNQPSYYHVQYDNGTNASPDGAANEGQQPLNGGTWTFPPGGTSCGAQGPSVYYADDADIFEHEFTGWLTAWESNGKPTPWCATVSFINPHDISRYPDWFNPTYPTITLPQTPAGGCKNDPNYPPVFSATPPIAPYTSIPTTWNYETSATLQSVKPSLQYYFQQSFQMQNGTITYPAGWVEFLNWYFSMQYIVDAQVGNVLSAVANIPNTVVVFTADHGDYGGSHGLHSKSGAVYDETIHVPLFVRLANGANTQGCAVQRNQMVSGVDFGALIVDLAYGNGSWRSIPTYVDLKTRQSILLFCYGKYSAETRVIPPTLPNATLPYILTTTDENFNPGGPAQSHVTCIRVNSQVVSSADPNPAPLGKFAIYSAWESCNITPATSPSPQYEFYDYVTDGNTYELNNDVVYTTQPTSGPAFDFFTDINPGSASSLFATELRAPLHNSSYACAQTTGISDYLNYLTPSCELQPCASSPPTCSS